MDRSQLVHPQLDVPALQGSHLLTRVVRQGGPVPVLDDDQCLVVEGEVDVPADQRPERLAR
jgi:hypothetical protein